MDSLSKAIDGNLSIYITGDYTKAQIDSIKAALWNVNVAKYNRKLNDPKSRIDHIVDSILNADIVIAIEPENDDERHFYIPFEVGYAKAMERRVIVVGESIWSAFAIAEEAADFHCTKWEDVIGILITLSDAAAMSVEIDTQEEVV